MAKLLKYLLKSISAVPGINDDQLRKIRANLSPIIKDYEIFQTLTKQQKDLLIYLGTRKQRISNQDLAAAFGLKIHTINNQIHLIRKKWPGLTTLEIIDKTRQF